VFETIIPADVVELMENNDLLIYSYCIRLTKSGPVLHIGAMFPYQKNKWEPLDVEENKELRADVKKGLRKLGYKAKMRSFVFPYNRVKDKRSGKRDINDFRLKVLLRVGKDIEAERVKKLEKVRRLVRREEKRAARRARLASQL
jgi:hypothetical protein